MKKMLLFLAVLTLTLTFVGCGGSGGNSNPVTSPVKTLTPSIVPTLTPSVIPTLSPSPSPSPNPYSSDYCGWEPGFELTYQITRMDLDTDNGAVKNYSITSNTIIREDGILKIIYDNYPDGSLVLKEANKYYDYGDWYSDRPDERHSPPYLIVSAPITNSFESSQWGKVTGQSYIVVPYGGFNAWVFERTEEIQNTGSSFKCNEYTWFVPYIGIIKIVHTDWKNGVMTNDFKAELISCAKGVTAKNGTLKSVQYRNTSSHRLNFFGKHIR